MSREIMDHIGELYSRHAALEQRLEAMIRPGTVAELDFSDPTKPRARIQHGTDAQGQPVLGPMLPWLSHAGEMNKWEPPTKGMQMVQFAPDGVFDNGVLIPFTHSQNVPAPSTDPNRHVSQYGQHGTDHGKDHFTRTIGSTSDHQGTADKRVNVSGKIEHTAGDANAAGSPSSSPLSAGALAPHDVNATLQSIVARLGQHDHFIAALHDSTSTLVDLGVSAIPAWIPEQILKWTHQPTGLQKSADAVLSNLPNYMGQSLMQSVAKLSTTFLGSVVETVQSNMSGQLSALLGQAPALLAGAGLSSAQSATASMYLSQAAAAVPAAAAGGSFELAAQLAGLTNLAAGTPAAAALAGIVGQMQGLMTSAGSLMSGLSGLLGTQDGAAAGSIKSMLLGGYGS